MKGGSYYERSISFRSGYQPELCLSLHDSCLAKLCMICLPKSLPFRRLTISFLLRTQYELIYQVFGRHNFSQITANLDVFLKHFNEIQYWVVTELVLQSNLAKRVHLLKKFIKIASV